MYERMFRTLARLTVAAAAALLTTQVVGTSTDVLAQGYGRPDGGWNAAQSGGAAQQDRVIRRVFNDVLKRDPRPRELQRYRRLMEEEYWTERDIRDDLRTRNDYRSYSNGGDVERIIRRAYQDVLHRDPDQQGLRNYRSLMIDKGWTEQDVRNALRDSEEHRSVGQASADRIIQRAYQDVLGRDPDPNGLSSYRNQILNNGWDEHDVRAALMKSPEYRQKNTLTRQQAVEIVNRAYQRILGRDADPSGMEGYVNRVLRDHWTEVDVARELRNSEEYRNKRR
jgi:hypothetical protein